MKRLLLALPVLIALGCSRPGVRGDGVIRVEPRAIRDFTKISAAGDYEIHWTAGKTTLNISADQNLLPLIKTAVSGDTLRIESGGKLSATAPVKLVLSGGSLTVVHVAGSIRFNAAQIASDSLKIEAAGDTAITVDGAVKDFDANLTGNGKLDAKTLQTDATNLTIIGSGQADVTAVKSLKVSVIGDGTCTYGGNPPMVEKAGIGSANVQPRS